LTSVVSLYTFPSAKRKLENLHTNRMCIAPERKVALLLSF